MRGSSAGGSINVTSDQSSPASHGAGSDHQARAGAQRWVGAIPWGPLEDTRAVLDDCHAFMDPAEADDRGIRLQLPEAYPA